MEQGESSWRSRTALLSIVIRDGRRWVQKVGDDWSQDDVARAVHGHQRWAAVLEHIPGAFTPTAIACEEPPSIFLEFVDGSDLSRAVSENRVSASQLRRCGAALGAYHQLDLPAATKPSDEYLRKWRRLLLLPRRIDNAARPVRSPGDFAPGNLRITTDDQLAVLDASSRGSIATCHRDIAWFLWKYAQKGGSNSHTFLDGYEQEARRQLAPDDHAAVWLYMAVMSLTRARRKLRRRELRSAGRLLTSALQARRLAGQSLRGKTTVDLNQWKAALQ